MGDNRRDEDLDRRLRERLAPLRGGRGVCPESEVLNRFAAGELCGPEALAVREHVARCGVCDVLLLRMRAFEEPQKRDWGWWPAALGYALALVMVVPAYRGLKPAEPAAEVPLGISLDATRAGGETTTAVAQGDRFLLHFFLPVKAGTSYQATIRRGDGTVVMGALPLESWDGQGSFTILCRTRDFEKGQYEVVVEEVEAGRVVGTRKLGFAGVAGGQRHSP
jgi:hypothetical protein